MRLLPSIALLSLLAAPAIQAQAPIRVMSFNIRYGTANDGEHAWPNRRAAVVTIIRDHAPHLIGFQEGLHFQLDELEQKLHRYQQFGVGRDDGKTAGEYAAIWVDTLRFQVIRNETFWFSDTPTVPGSKHWGNGITRISTWLRMVDRATGDTLRMYNNHWDHQSQPSREKSAAMLLARIGSDGSSRDGIIVTGDFNAEESNAATRLMLSAKGTPLRDTFRAVHPAVPEPPTFNGFGADLTRGKIDYVLVDPGWTVSDAGVDARLIDGRYPSDHFVVWALLHRTPR